MFNNADRPLSGPYIAKYLPIFREKLAKLERRGQRYSREAIRLRNILERIDRENERVAGADQTQHGLDRRAK
jgi:hypothetical protein